MSSEFKLQYHKQNKTKQKKQLIFTECESSSHTHPRKFWAGNGSWNMAGNRTEHPLCGQEGSLGKTRGLVVGHCAPAQEGLRRTETEEGPGLGTPASVDAHALQRRK
jgi:hypothetical protein